MVDIKVRSESEYLVQVGARWQTFLSNILAEHSKVLILLPETIANQIDLGEFTVEGSRLIYITPDGESQKTITTVEKIWELLGENDFGRKDAIVGIGGGATTDLAGFVAATWLRGIAWYGVPTTLAGMVDASVGGKTGINTSFGKNLVGSFYSPRGVCADPLWLNSLSDRDFSAGLAEVIKTGFIQDMGIVELLESCADIPAARNCATQLIAMSVAVKARVVSNDFKEGKLREILNFGHTFGHAIEKSSNYTLRHGEAVAIGLHYEALLSESVLGLPVDVTERLLALLVKFNLPTQISINEFSWQQLLNLMAGDKKSRDGQIRFVGISDIQTPGWIEEAQSGLLQEIYEKIQR